MNDTVIQLRGLRKRFGAAPRTGARGAAQATAEPTGVLAVDGIDLDVHRGEVVALLGPNGAGKTTTVDLALGLVPPTAGTATLFGADPRNAIVDGRVGAMLQGGALLADMTVRDAVTLVASAHRNPMPVDEALRRARVSDIAERRVGKLSGGQLQRARFAVAVVSDPDLLVLDEPTAAMDVEARHTFWESMHEFTDAGRTVVFATHYLDEADTFADRIVIMQAGRIVADGTPAEIKRTVSSRTVRCSGLDPVAHGSVGSLPGVTDLEARGDRVTLVTSDSDATLRALLAAHPEARDIEVLASTMDDAFLALTSTAAPVPSSADSLIGA